MKAAKRQIKIEYLSLCLLIIIILLLSAFNIAHYLSPKKILGTATEGNLKQEEFWSTFLSKNPNYIPGWIEVGRTDRAKEINPNYQSEFSN
jgi:hypothetical protein